MQTAIARLSGDADLRMRGTADRPVLLGRAEVLEGEISFNGTKYRLERGDVTFSNPAKTQPILDLQAATRVRDYDITIRLRGDASVPNGLKVTWQSEPQFAGSRRDRFGRSRPYTGRIGCGLAGERIVRLWWGSFRPAHQRGPQQHREQPLANACLARAASRLIRRG